MAIGRSAFDEAYPLWTRSAPRQAAPEGNCFIFDGGAEVALFKGRRGEVAVVQVADGRAAHTMGNQCRALPPIGLKAEFGNGLGLGQDLRAVQSLLGTPLQAVNGSNTNYLALIHATKDGMAAVSGADEIQDGYFIQVNVRFLDGRSAYIEVGGRAVKGRERAIPVR